MLVINTLQCDARTYNVKFQSQPFRSLSNWIQDYVRTKWLRKTSCLVLKCCAKKMYVEKVRRVLGVLISTPSRDKNMVHFFMTHEFFIKT